MINKAEAYKLISEYLGDGKSLALIGKDQGEKYFNDFQYVINWNFDGKLTIGEEFSGSISDYDKIILFGIDEQTAKSELAEMAEDVSKLECVPLECLVDLFDVNLNNLAKNKTIAIWGAGNLSRYIHIEKKMRALGLAPEFYLDGDCAKIGTVYDGLEVLDFDTVKNEKQLFIVVCSAYYSEIADRLKESGYAENVDFVSYLSVTTNASVMMKKALYAPVIDGPKCSLPFDMANIHREGIYVCPPDWINQLSIGTTTDDLNKSWNSLAADIFRLSIANSTFSFCNLELCGLMNERAIRENRENMSYDKYERRDCPSMLVLSHDHTCNLWCESCRNCLSVAKGAELAYAERITEELEASGWLSRADKLLIAGDGEVFSSQVYRKILYNETTNRESICILTNGNLLDENAFEKLNAKYKTIDIEVSIDAATEETYERLRRGGKWSRLYANLKRLGEYRKEGRIRYLCIRMVVQSTNIHEMPAFVDLGKEIGVDLVRFARIRNFGSYSPEEFKSITIMTSENSEGEIKEEFADILKNPILRDSIVGMYDMEKLIGDNKRTMSDVSEKFDNLIYL